MGFHHLPSEYFWVSVLIGALLVWLFNSYRLGKFQGKKKVLPLVIGGILLCAAAVFFLLTG